MDLLSEDATLRFYVIFNHANGKPKPNSEKRNLPMFFTDLLPTAARVPLAGSTRAVVFLFTDSVAERLRHALTSADVTRTASVRSVDAAGAVRLAPVVPGSIPGRVTLLEDAAPRPGRYDGAA